MDLKIHLPLKSEIVFRGMEMKVAPKGDSWEKNQCGEYAEKSGVYIHHSNGKILYVGKTTSGDWGKFGERLRREFQESASSKSNLHQLLAAQTKPVLSYFFDLDDIDMMIDGPANFLTRERKALILEQVLIGLFEPEGNKAK